jgi:paraquat-inducible protein A
MATKSGKFHAFAGAAMKAVKLFVSFSILTVSIILCRSILVHSNSNQTHKSDYAELNHIKYGLLSIDEWKRQIAVILAEEINNLNLTEANQQALRKHIEKVLASLIDEIDRKVRAANADSASGRFKQSVIDAFVSVKEIKKDVPAYADIVLKEMKKAEKKGELKAALTRKLDQYFSNTYGTKNTAQIKRILQRNDRVDIESARDRLGKLIGDNHNLVFRETIVLIVLSVFSFALYGFSRKPLSPPAFAMLVMTLVLLLTAGVTTPMIDIEAKISSLSFVLVGHPIHFDNQVMYFQSKSILDVFRIMIAHKDVLMKLVGVLLITFSVFFPLLKIMSSFLYYYNYGRARDRSLVRFFVLKSGKWSMADVMVIAMFMTYIGFNGIVNSQLGQLREMGEHLDVLTTNGTSLQPGFYLFLTYVLLGLFFAGFLTRKNQAAEAEKPAEV